MINIIPGLASDDGPSRDVQMPDQGYIVDVRSPQLIVTCLCLVRSDSGFGTSDSSSMMIQLFVDPEFDYVQIDSSQIQQSPNLHNYLYELSSKCYLGVSRYPMFKTGGKYYVLWIIVALI